jgi:hypothetical protein
MDAFADFDRHHRLTVTRAQFLRGLRALGLEGVSPAAMEAVADHFTAATGSDERLSGGVRDHEPVRYADFSDAVEAAFSAKGLERSPSGPAGDGGFARSVVTAPPPRFVRPQLEPAQAEAYRAAMDGILEEVRKRRLYGLKEA